ncbi:NAD(P)H-dependent oxidoreductase [Pseudobacteriovorax antillogorgiicola]|uniref:Kef-type potassium/proton antiporter accessory protein, CPA2 family n=1 Tax=Pseudobacteriovorax antillogorgiicola TaxID=1513793 RepID=A0A1Y6BXM8_9BACT|nr:NAD(P)H-dependent oxidoreductase [Pseudobacteriovorax antillogorgiicola]TCS53050.1 Kef-type potassium/proton antiporter accessory protein (CPA2 family) [Pseudobacteriovorax antillogorgiicola]SMF26420.1 Kef-type potassium/proton antiporter accessory protein, CPA2 family [Pseudobacteriovorax antillogorgiicola]
MTKKKNAKILILFAHPAPYQSEVNLPLFWASKAEDDVTVVDLYGEYPRFRINIDREQQRLLEHDVLVFMFPLYWYSTPAILKEWQDLVLEYGFAYGADGAALKGKTFLCAVSAGGPAQAYCEEGYNHYTIRELLRPLEQTASLTGMNFLPPFALFSSRSAVEDSRLENHIQDWKRVLQALREGRVDYEAADRLNRINANLDLVIKEPT